MNVVALVISSVLNTFWQAILLSFIVWAALRLLQRHVNAATRYLIWWVTLMAVFVLPFGLRTPSPPSIPKPAPDPSVQRVLPAQVPAPLAPPVSFAAVTVPHEPAARWPLWVLAIWAVVFALGILRILGSYFYLRGVKSRATAWTCPLPTLRRLVRVLLSDELASPGAVGFLHPAIIMPDKLRAQLTVEELNGALWHEAAHLARYDDWLNLIGRVLAAAAALHPAVWWILRQIQHEREVACDDWVVAQTRTAHSYAESLVRIAELVVGRRESVLASGIFTDRSRLRARIELLVRSGRTFSVRVGRSAIVTAVFALAGLALAGALAPHWFAFAQKLEFEVASVRENTSNSYPDFLPRRSGDLVLMHNTRIGMVFSYAYNLTGAYQVEGMDRFSEVRIWYDINAKATKDATDLQIRLMLQALLADRFKLKVHREKRDITQYALVTHNNKSKLKPAGDRPMQVTIEGKTFTQREGTCGMSLWREGTRWTCRAVTMDKIAASVSSHLATPVVDRTGLTGTYDLNVRYVPDGRRLDPDVPPGPTLEQALQEELGLKLEKGKGPVEVLVIDHVEKPSEN